MEGKENIVPHRHLITAYDRNKQNQHHGLLIWFTGFSGSGKSTIANRVEQLLFDQGIHTYLLDGDNVRTGLNRDLEFSEAHRYENIRRTAEVCKLFIDAGTLVLGAFVSPLKTDRELVRKIVGDDKFIEIHVNTSLEECERRDVKGLYKKAREGKIQNFTGISAPYEIPDTPDIRIDTAKTDIDQSANIIVDYLFTIKKIKL